ncbi:MAG: hypothetical protein LBS33_00275 [Streptococcaceae bacterium]|nr:hypothetical protein [Streptococcaceae bacterium]
MIGLVMMTLVTVCSVVAEETQPIKVVVTVKNEDKPIEKQSVTMINVETMLAYLTTGNDPEKIEQTAEWRLLAEILPKTGDALKLSDELQLGIGIAHDAKTAQMIIKKLYQLPEGKILLNAVAGERGKGVFRGFADVATTRWDGKGWATLQEKGNYLFAAGDTLQFYNITKDQSITMQVGETPDLQIELLNVSQITEQTTSYQNQYSEKNNSIEPNESFQYKITVARPEKEDGNYLRLFPDSNISIDRMNVAYQPIPFQPNLEVEGNIGTVRFIDNINLTDFIPYYYEVDLNQLFVSSTNQTVDLVVTAHLIPRLDVTQAIGSTDSTLHFSRVLVPNMNYKMNVEYQRDGDNLRKDTDSLSVAEQNFAMYNGKNDTLMQGAEYALGKQDVNGDIYLLTKVNENQTWEKFSTNDKSLKLVANQTVKSKKFQRFKQKIDGIKNEKVSFSGGNRYMLLDNQVDKLAIDDSNRYVTATQQEKGNRSLFNITGLESSNVYFIYPLKSPKGYQAIDQFKTFDIVDNNKQATRLTNVSLNAKIPNQSYLKAPYIALLNLKTNERSRLKLPNHLAVALIAISAILLITTFGWLLVRYGGANYAE